MDPIKILKRAWQILWSYRSLWVFGLILALAGGGSSGGNGNTGYQFNNNDQQFNQYWHPEDMPQTFQEAVDAMQLAFNELNREFNLGQQELNSLLGLLIAVVVFFVLLGIVTAIARYVAETAILRMVDAYETSGTKMTVRQGFRIGWSRTSWRLFLINLIVNLPLFVFLGVFLIAGVVIYRMVADGNQFASAIGIISVIGLLFLALFMAIILGIFLHLLRQFFWRACALEDLDVRTSLARGFAMARENWKSVGLMWLVMIGLGIVWALVVLILVIITLPLIALTFVAALLVSAVPTLLLVGLFSLFMGGVLPWVAAILFVLPLFFTLAFSPWYLLGSWRAVFTSSVWTLTYRELKALPDASPPQVEPDAS